MNPGWSLVDMLLFPIYKTETKLCDHPPLDCTLGWARKRRLAGIVWKKPLSPTVTGA